MADSSPETQGKFLRGLNILFCQNERKYLKNDRDILKRHRSQNEGALTDQVWNNLSMKTKNDKTDYYPLNKRNNWSVHMGIFE